MKRLLILILMSLSACANSQARDESVPTPTSKYAVELTEQEKKLMPRWLEYDCSVDFKKAGQYQKCVATITNSLPPLDPKRREHFGEEYSPERYYECRMATAPRDLSCNKHRLRRAENPAFWPYPDVPPPKLPEPPNPPVYRAGMSAKQYFEALCKAEAGDFIYKTVDDVEGIYQIRPRAKLDEIGDEHLDRFVMEDPYGHEEWMAKGPQHIFVGEKEGYMFFETSASGRVTNDNGEAENPDPKTLGASPQAKFYRYFTSEPYDYKFRRREAHAELRSRFGFYWRSIPRPHDREMGIAGGELIVLDLKTNEILAVHRGFNLNGNARTRTGILWGTGRICDPKNGRLFFYEEFIASVLKPKHKLSN